jgi:uncharacterized OsmC-like protein
MTGDIANSIERLERALASRPGFGIGTWRGVTTLTDGLRCTTEDGPWRIEADLTDRLGGSDSAPSPSALVRAALGSCVAMCYRLRAAKHGVPLASVRVTVETDSALAGMLQPDSGEAPGFRAIRYHVEVESTAPIDDVLRVIDEGDRLSPVLDDLSRANRAERTVEVITPSTAAEVA